MMKKAFFIVGAGIIAVGVALLFTNCKGFFGGNGQGGGDESDGDKSVWCTLSFEDSISIHDSHAYQKISIDFPADIDSTKADACTLAAVRWIQKKVLSNSYPEWESDGISPNAVPALTLSSESANAFIEACGRKGLDSMAASIKEMAEDGFGGSYYNGLTIELLEETDDYLTLNSGYETYTGGAHGGFLSDGVTFSKKDGKEMGWNLFDMTKKEEIRSLLIGGVKSYFNEFAEEKIETNEQLYEMLLLFDDPETPEDETICGLPFPQTVPCVTHKGISFVYQQYEIASYACGLPSFTLSFDEVTPVLSEEGKALVNSLRSK